MLDKERNQPPPWPGAPLARLAWTALLCVAGVQGRDGAVQPAGLGSVRRRGSPGFLQGCVVLDAERPLGLGWAILLGGRTRPRTSSQVGLTCLSCSPEGPTCAPAHAYCCPGWRTLPGGNQCVVRECRCL